MCKTSTGLSDIQWSRNFFIGTKTEIFQFHLQSCSTKLPKFQPSSTTSGSENFVSANLYIEIVFIQFGTLFQFTRHPSKKHSKRSSSVPVLDLEAMPDGDRLDGGLQRSQSMLGDGFTDSNHNQGSTVPAPLTKQHPNRKLINEMMLASGSLKRQHRIEQR